MICDIIADKYQTDKHNICNVEISNSSFGFNNYLYVNTILSRKGAEILKIVGHLPHTHS